MTLRTDIGQKVIDASDILIDINVIDSPNGDWWVGLVLGC